ncbi:MAG: transcription elongation factor GreA [Thermoguttaceae bacterium]|nr:transcription elongation factor GreA [Thermoguttaceae bacterium]MDO5565046.1 transcription elongation factor GreA [Planctomycetia bacterium]
MFDERIPMTQEGYNRLKKEIDRLENEEMPIILERLANARAEGDLSENAEYHGARESQGLLQAKIDDLKNRLGRAQIIDTSKIPQDEIRFGATIEVKRLNDNRTLVYTLVGAGDEDFDTGKILVTCPLAQGFLGRKVGDTVEIKVPAGLKKFEVIKISYNQ